MSAFTLSSSVSALQKLVHSSPLLFRAEAVIVKIALIFVVTAQVIGCTWLR